MTIGPVIWLTMNFSVLKGKNIPFVENPEDHVE
jgi:hypothetical protein